MQLRLLSAGLLTLFQVTVRETFRPCHCHPKGTLCLATMRAAVPKSNNLATTSLDCPWQPAENGASPASSRTFCSPIWPTISWPIFIIGPEWLSFRQLRPETHHQRYPCYTRSSRFRGRTTQTNRLSISNAKCRRPDRLPETTRFSLLIPNRIPLCLGYRIELPCIWAKIR